jgi:O-antigen/teichoic acid export membrane protein
MFLMAGSGMSSLLAIGISVLLARRLGPSLFAGVNLIMAAAISVTMLGAGIDSAAARLITRAAFEHTASERLILGAARGWRGAVMLACVPPAVVFFIIAPAVGSYSVVLATIGWLGLTAGLSALNLTLIRPQARGTVGSYSLLQLVFYGLLLTGVLVGHFKSLSAQETLLIMSVGSAGFSLAYLAIHRGRLFDWGVVPLNALASRMLVSAGLIAVFDRLDLFYVGASLTPTKVGLYGVAVRLAGGLAVASGGVSVFAISRVTTATSRADFGRRYKQLLPVMTVVAMLTSFVLIFADWLVPSIFGSEYSSAVPWVRIIALQYPVAAFTAPITHLLPFLGRPRWQWEHTAVLVGVAAVILLVSGGDLGVIAWSRPLGQIFGAAYLCIRYLQFEQ